MIRAKICGLTRAEDALHAARLGAWALGFVFARGSRRFIEPHRAGEIVAAVREAGHTALAVGVFVDATPGDVAAIARDARLDAVQLHGEETPEDCARVWSFAPKLMIFKAFRPRAPGDLDRIADYAGLYEALVLDAWDPAQAGGTGQRADWALARPVARSARLILAGGIGPHNVAEAVSAVSPWAVDLSSGVESSPGIKCGEKLSEFFQVLGRVAA